MKPSHGFIIAVHVIIYQMFSSKTTYSECGYMSQILSLGLEHTTFQLGVEQPSTTRLYIYDGDDGFVEDMVMMVV
jgi:hypothetical protein